MWILMAALSALAEFGKMWYKIKGNMTTQKIVYYDIPLKNLLEGNQYE